MPRCSRAASTGRGVRTDASLGGGSLPTRPRSRVGSTTSQFFFCEEPRLAALMNPFLVRQEGRPEIRQDLDANIPPCVK